MTWNWRLQADWDVMRASPEHAKVIEAYRAFQAALEAFETAYPASPGWWWEVSEDGANGASCMVMECADIEDR